VAGIGEHHQKVHLENIHGLDTMVIHMAENHAHAKSLDEKVSLSKHPVTPKIAIMDCLTHNNDRHSFNVMTSPEGHPLAIDHERAFRYRFPTDEGPDWTVPYSLTSGKSHNQFLDETMTPELHSWWKESKSKIRDAMEHCVKQRPPNTGNQTAFMDRFDKCAKTVDNEFKKRGFE
jgi:hypothetical protein